MAQYGNKSSKNPPWARTDQGGMGMNQNQMQQQMLNANLSAALPNAAMLQYPQQQMFQGQMGFQQQMYGNMGTVQYPTRALNSAAFQNQPVQSSMNRSNEQNKEKVITGTVTKLQDNFGFVDDDIFFQTSCVTNGVNNLRIGSRVLVEATYNSTMPFKWNAQRIQVLPNSSQPQQQRGKYNSGGQSNDGGSGDRFNSNRFGNRNQQQNKNKSMQQNQNQQGRRMPNRDRSLSVDSDRKRRRPDRRRTPSKERNDKKSRSKSRSPARKKRRPFIPRYNVQVPKFSLNNFENDVMDLKRKFNNMYIPSDFFMSRSNWLNCFPLEKPFNIDCPCKYHVFHKEVVPLQKPAPEPLDVDYLYCAKVILLASPGLEELFKKCISLAESNARSDSHSPEEDLTIPSRLIQVLVGQRGKEPMAIGGPWSPSMDGADPASDPGVLIKTAIRSTKYQTGIDLSNCTHWLRFLEIHYHRGESVHKGKTIPARVETVVLFIPDVWSCVPTRPEWEQLHEAYAKQMNRQLTKAIDPEADEKEENEAGEEKAEEEDEDGVETVKKEPTHYSELDPKNMKVSDLRDELEARNLSPKGLKSQLVARLTKVIKAEADAEEQKEEEGKEKGLSDDELDYEEMKEDEKEDTEKEKEEDKEKEEEKKKIDEKEKALFEKRYKLPESPQLLVHPHPELKAGKFNCVTASLYSLLNYRIEDNKEHSFEMFLFAEMFNSMLMRDFSFQIYRSICIAAAKAKEEIKEIKEKEKEKDEKDKDNKEKKDKPKDVKDNKETEKKTEKDDKKIADKDEKKDEKKVEKEEKKPEIKKPEEEIKKEKEGEEEKEDDKESVLSKDRKDEKKDEKKKEKVKLITSDPYLLLAYAYFDNTHCGYIVDRDLEDILTSLNLSLSRAQAKKLVQKVVTKDSLHYRKLTDKSAEEIEESKDDTLDEKYSVACSNRELLAKTEGDKTAVTTKAEKLDSGFVMYNGSLIDVGKLMGQLEKNEASRLSTEKLYNKLFEENDNLKHNHEESVKAVKELSTELSTFKKRLSTSNNDLDCMSAKVMRYVDVIFRIKKQIDPIIIENTPEEVEPIMPLIKVEVNNKKDQPESNKTKSGKESTEVEVVEVKTEKKPKVAEKEKSDKEKKEVEEKKAKETVKMEVEEKDPIKTEPETKKEESVPDKMEVVEVEEEEEENKSGDIVEKENGEQETADNDDGKSDKSSDNTDDKTKGKRKAAIKEEAVKRTPAKREMKKEVATPSTPSRRKRN